VIGRPATLARTAPGALARVPLRVLVPVAILALYVVIAVAGPTLVAFDPIATNTRVRLLPPGSVLPSGEIAWLGTDQLGRDVLGQVVYGARISLMVGFATIVLATAAGMALGMIAGYARGPLDAVLMRFADIQLAFPSILLAIFITAFLEPSVVNVIVVLAVTRWVAFARVARAVTLSVNELEYVDAARVLGASHPRILLTCILPACVSPILVVATAELGLVIIAEASLSFLGLGSPPTTPSWGLIVANGRDYLHNAWWIATMPGLALAVLVVSVGTLGDALRDLLDPRLS